MNLLVLAKLQKLTADAVLAHEKILARQRSTPTIGRHATQLSLQRQAKELKAQLDAWERIFSLAVADENEGSES